MENQTSSTSDAVYLRARPSVYILHFCIAFLLFTFSLFKFLSIRGPSISLERFLSFSSICSFLFFLVLCLFVKPYIVADDSGVCINTRWRKRRFSWSQIKEVEWRPLLHGVPGMGAGGPTYVARVDPLLIGQDGQELALISYGVWGRDETEQGQFIEFVGKHIQ